MTVQDCDWLEKLAVRLYEDKKLLYSELDSIEKFLVELRKIVKG